MSRRSGFNGDLHHPKTVPMVDGRASPYGGLYPNAIELLKLLKEADYSIYIASNGLKKYLDAIVNFYNINTLITETFSIEQIDSFDKSDLIYSVIQKHNAYHAGRQSGSLPTVLNAANEVANNLYLNGKIPFLSIEKLIHNAMEAHNMIQNLS